MASLKKHALIFIPGLALLFLNYGNYWSAHWYTKWSLIVAMFSVIYSYIIAKKTSLFLFPILAVSLLSGSWVSVWLNNQYPSTTDLLMLTTLQSGAMYAYLVVVMASMVIAFLNPCFKTAVENFLAAVCVLSSLYMLAEYKETAYHRGAFSGNAGMSACLIACLLPFALRIRKELTIPIIAISGTACVLSHSSMGIGVFCLVLIVSALQHYKASLKSMLLLGFLTGLPLAYALKYLPIPAFSSSGRVIVWKAVFRWWAMNSPILFGSGLGTGISLFPTIQKLSNTTEAGYFLWLHSEFLQVLFELGLVGFVAGVVALLYLAGRAISRPHLFASFIGFCACALADYPLRLPIHCTSAVLLVWLIVSDKGGEYGIR